MEAKLSISPRSTWEQLRNGLGLTYVLGPEFAIESR